MPLYQRLSALCMGILSLVGLYRLITAHEVLHLLMVVLVVDILAILVVFPIVGVAIGKTNKTPEEQKWLNIQAFKLISISIWLVASATIMIICEVSYEIPKTRPIRTH